MGNPRIAKFDQSQSITWSNGDNFSGYAYIGLVDPTYGVSDDATSEEVRLYSPPCQVPNRIPIPIKDGKCNGSLGLWFNADLGPPNSRYAWYLYDTTKRQLAGPSSYFTVTADPVTLPTLTATVPSVGTNIPQPN